MTIFKQRKHVASDENVELDTNIHSVADSKVKVERGSWFANLIGIVFFYFTESQDNSCSKRAVESEQSRYQEHFQLFQTKPQDLIIQYSS